MAVTAPFTRTRNERLYTAIKLLNDIVSKGKGRGGYAKMVNTLFGE
jgi:hypothetical protein